MSALEPWMLPPLTAGELIGLLEQLPAGTPLRVEGDEIVRPRLVALLPGGRDVCLMDPAYAEVDHVDGRIRS